MNRWRTVVPLHVALAALVAHGCESEDSPTPPDPPSDPPVYQTPNTPEHVLFNLMLSLERDDLVVYRSSLEPGYRFEGDEVFTRAEDDASTARWLAATTDVAVEWAEDTRAVPSTDPRFPAVDGYREIALDDVQITADEDGGRLWVTSSSRFIFAETSGDGDDRRHELWQVVLHEETGGGEIPSWSWSELKRRYAR